jgi:hypothetical protein
LPVKIIAQAVFRYGALPYEVFAEQPTVCALRCERVVKLLLRDNLPFNKQFTK